MQTTCPECKTIFRLSQEQLGLRRGLVRCGHCKAVFNAYHTLMPDLITPPAVVDDPVPQSPPEPEPENPDPFPMDATIPESPLVPIPVPVSARVPAVIVPAQDVLLSELPFSPSPPRTVLKRVIHAGLSLFLSVLLCAQLAYLLRGELSNRMPYIRPLLTAFCAPIGCTVPLPRGLDKRAISSSSLEHDPERVSSVRLTLLITNRTAFTQTWPWLVLTLTDLRESPVAVKTFPPQVYLPAGLGADKGINAGTEHEIRLDLDLGKIEASGYNLDLIYP